MPTGTSNPRRLLVVHSHVIQYSAPNFRAMVQDSRVELLVAYCSMQGAESGVDPGFGVEVSWDTSLLEGYPWTHVRNRAFRPGLGRFFGLVNPGLWTLIRKGNFDAVLIPGYFYASAWIAILAAKWHSVPVIFATDAHSLRTWKTQSPWKLEIKKRLVGRIFGLAKAVIVSSSGGVEYLRSLGFPADQIILAPFVVDNAWWTRRAAAVDRCAARAAWRIPAEAPLVLFCAKLQPWKAPVDLLEAFVRAGVPNSYLAFAGDGPERGNLERRAADLGLQDRVRFLGFLNQSQLPAAYCAADLFVLPSLFEPFGLVVNEAMLCGLPVVVSDRVGARFDLVRPGENGYVFPAGDIDVLAAILQEVLLDAPLRARLGAAARQRMKSWSPHEYVDSVAQAVESVCNDKIIS